MENEDGVKISENLIKRKCPNCGEELNRQIWKNNDDIVYCSEECRYSAETRNSGEEY
jgi:ssDNA-binding Zn-finger/Zn-ribbon topoisomerase 1